MTVAICVALAGCAAPNAASQDQNWTTADDLISTSDRIVIARLVATRLDTIEIRDSVNGAVTGEVDELFRQFEIVESFKGTADAEDLLWIAFEPGAAGELVDGNGEIIDFSGDRSFVLFLKGRLRPFDYPPDIGGVLWTGNGEPSFAELVNDDLRFIAERPYLDLLKRTGRDLPDRHSAAPFTLTLHDVREAS